MRFKFRSGFIPTFISLPQLLLGISDPEEQLCTSLDNPRSNLAFHSSSHPREFLLFVGTPVPPVLGETTVEQSRDPSVQPSTELPLDYSRDPYKEEGMEQTGNTGVQEGEQDTWEMSGEPSTESTPNPSVEPSQEPIQESTTEISSKAHFIFDCSHAIVISFVFVSPALLPFLH